jgi:ankyrin repeat protein
MALQRGHVEISQLLLEHGADRNILDQTLLHTASCEGRLEIVQLLLSAVQMQIPGTTAARLNCIWHREKDI